ncbi:MAG: ribbon-helix-helix domain-containing protein [Candidatus Woesearchaeota archaeon]|nr:ribbon-helix-helix domain-containing protein [Nanoarchaeota archaeon]MBU1973918.1 ribbon-helix-helix domain-containing protein [Nanoarchaeota archaeon]
MTMEVAQVRLPERLMEEVDNLVDKGLYTNKSDVIRDALRKLILEKQIGTIPNTGDSVKEIREIRKKLSKEIKSFKDIEEINKLVD